MGKYQNVGTPKFYVDYFQWLLVTGQKNASNLLGTFSDEGDVGNFLFNLSWSERKELTKLFYLNPTSSYTFNAGSGENSGLTINLGLNSDDDYSMNYAMILNHNFKETGVGFVVKQYDGTVADQVAPINIINHDDTDIAYNGWSFIDFANQIEATISDIQTMFLRLDHPIAQEGIKMGAISIGTYYEMPHSPDLDLTMTREFGGAKKQFTKGGALLTNYNYTQQPTWGDGEAWGLYESVESNLGARRAGRRVWDLKFSYLSASDIMPEIEMIRRYRPSDLDSYEPSLSSDTFFSQFMQKTLGGSLRFIFQPDGSDYNPDGFAICVLDQDSISIKQVAHNTYNISLKIMEVW
jgi:hypothetical protein